MPQDPGYDEARSALGIAADAAKIAFEKYFLWKMKHGYVKLP